MNLKTVSIADLKPHPDNPNTHPTKQIDALADSLAKFTQIKNVVIWNDRIIAGHGVIEAAKKAGILTLEAQDISHWPEERATEFMLADIRLPDMGIYDEAAMAEALRNIDEPLDIPGVDEEFLKGLEGWEVKEPPPAPDPPVDKAEELQEKWQVKPSDIWQIESKSNPGQYHRLICGDCRDTATVEPLTDGTKVNGIFTSPPYAMQRAKQYGGTPADEYVEWWELVQGNMRAVLAEDGSFFVNIKPHCSDGQRVLYVFDMVLAMVRRWGWRFVDEYSWKHGGTPGKPETRFKNQFEPVYQFSIGNYKWIPDNCMFISNGAFVPAGRPNVSKHQDGRSTLSGVETFEGKVYPGNVVEVGKNNTATGQAAAFPIKLPTFFIKAYSDKSDIWLDPFAGSGTVLLACENEKRIGLGIEQLPKYCAVILERLTGAGMTAELIK